jgi:multiple sugar transport system substrate-binding protein/putative aldouronate transport system substrate-binding protein
MQLALEKNRGITGGTVYGFGHNVAGSSEDHEQHIYYPYLRWDLYQALGKPPINTLEDYIPILAAMKDLEPLSAIGTPTYGVSSFPDWDDDMVMMVKSTAALYGWEEFGMGLYHVVTQEFEGCLEPDGWYIRCLKFYNTLHQMGLYDPDSMSQNFNDAAAKYRNGVSFWNIFTFVAESFNTTANLEAGRSMQCVPAADQLNLVDGLNVYGNNRVWAIGANSEFPELAMEIINWLCTPEGVLTHHYGPRGVTWDYDEHGNTYLTPIGFTTRDDKRAIIEFNGIEMIYQEGEFQHNNTTWNIDSVNPDAANGDTFNWRHWESTIRTQPVSETEASWRVWAGDVVTADEFLRNEEKVAVSLGTPFSFGEQDDQLEVTWEQVTQEIVSSSWSAIYANSDEDFDRIVADMIRNATAYGYAECIAWLEVEAERRREEENKILAMR